MNSKTDFTRYKRLARILKVVMKVSFGASIAIAVIALLAWVVFQFMPLPESIFAKSGNAHITLTLEGMVNYKFDPATASPEDIGMIFKTILMMIAAVSAVMATIFHQVAAILKTVENDRPFSADNSRRLRRIGIILIIGSSVARSAEYFVIQAVINAFGLKDITLNYGINSSMVIVGFLMFILAGVFRYGSYLQQEYDETV